MEIVFKPLTKEKLDEALKIIDLVFGDERNLIKEVYEASLGFLNRKERLEGKRILEYWTALDADSQEILALTGFYQYNEHALDEIWLGWYCVAPAHRGLGIGRKTLEWTVEEARTRGYTYFRLWTTNNPTEAVAQELYESMRLRIYKQERGVGSDELILYRELKL